MKKILAIALVLIMMLTVVGCGMEKPVHTHSYSQKVTTAANCAEQGYTTYTCSCGDTYKDNYTTLPHSYTKYKCTKCGTVDKAHTYEYLVEWVKQNGEVSGEYISVTTWVFDSSSSTFSISYSASGNYLSASITFDEEFILIDLSSADNKFDYYCSYNNNEIKAYGKIDGNTYTDTRSPISCDRYYGVREMRPKFMTWAKNALWLTVGCLNSYIETHIPEISINDLGFKSYK